MRTVQKSAKICGWLAAVLAGGLACGGGDPTVSLGADMTVACEGSDVTVSWQTSGSQVELWDVGNGRLISERLRGPFTLRNVQPGTLALRLIGRRGDRASSVDRIIPVYPASGAITYSIPTECQQPLADRLLAGEIPLRPVDRAFLVTGITVPARQFGLTVTRVDDPVYPTARFGPRQTFASLSGRHPLSSPWRISGSLNDQEDCTPWQRGEPIPMRPPPAIPVTFTYVCSR
jgi:hypothetical protein